MINFINIFSYPIFIKLYKNQKFFLSLQTTIMNRLKQIESMEETHPKTKRHKVKVKKLKNSPYAIAELEVLGSGSFSVIKKAYNTENLSEQLAVKIISISDRQSSATIKSELQMLKQLPHHPNLVNNIKIQISTQNNFYIFMELCNQGNLEKYINTHTQGFDDISQQKIWFFLKQVCAGYNALYQKNIVHRDIKPQNILIKNGDFKIGDFGLSKIIKDVETISNMSSKGTPLYMAPELQLQKQGSSKVDIFSLGVILYRMAFRGKFPFFERGRTYHSTADYFKELMRKVLVFPKQHSRSTQLLILIERMLKKNPEERISWKQIFQIEKIKNAVRNERRKQMISMDQFRKSLFIVNSSVAKVQKIEEEASEETSECSVIEHNQQNGEQKKQNYLIIEQAFLKQDRSKVEKKMYHNKLMYTLIDIANRRMLKVIQQSKEEIHPYIIEQIQKIMVSGLCFSLYIIQKLEDISGDWNSMKEGELMNFQDIFQSDREIILEKLKKKNESIGANYATGTYRYSVGLYEEQIYHLITQYFQYPKQVKQALKIVVSFLLEIYDLVIKYHQVYEVNSVYAIEEKQYEEQMQQNWLQRLTCEKEAHSFEQFLFKVIEQRKSEDLVKKMKKMGLLIL